MPLLEEVMSVLESADVGRPNVDLFAGSAVRIPQQLTAPLTTVRETGGAESLGVHEPADEDGSPSEYDQPTGQIVVRAPTLVEARDKAAEAYRALNRVRSTEVLGTYYVFIQPQQRPFDMGVDANGNPRYGFNFRALKRPS